jgi:hypothetical protein
MNEWPDRLKLLTVLSTVKVLLETVSTKESFSGIEPSESLQTINHAISYFLDPEGNVYPEKLSMHFGPTGPVQEISIANGWSEVFLKLSAEFDKYEHSLKEQ